MHERHDKLVGDDYEIVPFHDLPKPYQMAVAWYMAVNGGAWEDVEFEVPDFDGPDRAESLKKGLEDALPLFAERYGDVLFGVASVPTEAVKASVMQDEELAADWNGEWDRYHAWYASHANMPDHPRDDRWPCVLSSWESETFQDGWHRFHSYCLAGDADIPVVFYPAQRHLDAKMAAPGIR